MKPQLYKQITSILITIVMLVLLVFNLFPIFWMVYNSFKGNTEILSGDVGLKKAETNVVYLQSSPDAYFIGTSDGALTKIDKKNEAKHYFSLRSLSTVFFSDNDAFWIASSDKGMVKISRDTLTLLKKVQLPKEAMPTVELFRDNSRFTVVDVPNIGRFSMTGSADKLWLAAESPNIGKIMEYDKENGTFSVIEIPTQYTFSVISSLEYDRYKNVLWIGTDAGVIRYDVANKGFAPISVGTDYLPAGPQKLRSISPEELVFQTATNVYLIDKASGKVQRKYFDENQIGSDQEINCFSYAADKFYLGTNSGIVVVDKNSGKVTDKDVRFAKLIAGNKLDPKEEEASEVRAVAATPKEVVIGSSLGRVSIYSPELTKSVKKVQTGPGHIVMFESGWRNYIDMWPNVDFGKYLKNSVIICGITMVIAMILATMTAYAVVRFKFPGVKLFSSSILITQMIPAILYLIPLFMLFNMIKDSTAQMSILKAIMGPGFQGIMIKGTYAGMIFIYSAWFLPFSIWILRGFFAAIPVELEEAATIDGCSNLGVFWRITLPLAIPGIVATGIFILIQAWDELMFAWMLTNEATQTLPVGIRLFVGNYQNRYDLMMAAATIATIPVLFLFFVLQKHIVRGLTAGAVKG